ncbi:MAG: AMP-binding protein [Deltaproteobacteria bacterium]|nr:AMP-binding protein [Deltaproteobacteria bacterium]
MSANPIIITPTSGGGPAISLCRRLRQCGVEPDSRIAIIAGNSEKFVVARDALALLGAIAVPVHPLLTAPEIRYLLGHSGAERVLVDDEHAEVAKAACRDLESSPAIDAIDWRDEGGDAGAPIGATLIYTSGTTGEPKGCLRTAAQERARAEELIASYSLTDDDVQLVASPLTHSAPGIFARAARLAGATTVLLPRFEPELVLEQIERHRVSFFFMVPTQYERLLGLPRATRGNYDLSSVRVAIVAGAPMPPATKERVTRWLGPILWEFYGSSETGTVSVLSPEHGASNPRSVGKLAAGVKLEIRGLDGIPLAPGKQGELFVNSETVMAGYTEPGGGPPTGRPELVSVGDLGYLDDDGFLYLVGRATDTIITGGVNVYPAEVERALAAHPAVHRCVVFGRDDDDWGQRVEALVTLEPEAELDHAELKAFLAERLAPFKIPKRFAVVSGESIPIGASGKAVRRLAHTVSGEPLR